MAYNLPSKGASSNGLDSGSSNPSSTTHTTTKPTSSPTSSSTKTSNNSCILDVTASNGRIMASTAYSDQGSSASTTGDGFLFTSVCRRCGNQSNNVKKGYCFPFIPRPGSSSNRLKMLSKDHTGCSSRGKGIDFDALARLYLDPGPDWDDGTGDGDDSDDGLTSADTPGGQSSPPVQGRSNESQ
ncbi:hypothetical protein PG996_013825 [Apiospora saccharicola]|uniref:CENP-V/GFA domain-containing protein n=1 Tax=Apiospora saccharicola TaxID=335842 RepID=A0ABR1TGJ7_9PEZI